MTSAKRRRDLSRAFYDPNVEDYAARDEVKWSAPSVTATSLERVVGELKPRTVLELGVGTGRYFPYLSGQDYTGVDVSEAMLAVAAGRAGLLRDRGFDTVRLVDQDLGNYLATKPEPVDFIFSIGCLGLHVPLTRRLFADLAGALRPGGSIFVQSPQPLRSRMRSFRIAVDPTQKFHHAAIAESTMRRRARSAGLHVVWSGEDPRLWNHRPLLLVVLRRD